MLLVFGVVLVVSGIKVLRHRDDEGTARPRPRGEAARALPPRPLRARRPDTSSSARPGKWVATPLLAALVVVEVTDVVFAVDSVPAILAVSREPFIVFSSNAFAILGLRAMYFLLGDARERFHYLSHALGRDPRVRRAQDGAVALVAHADARVAGRHRRHPRGGDQRQRPAQTDVQKVRRSGIMSLVKGDRVEIVVELGGGETRTYEIVATRAGRRVETTTGRGIVEVTEVTRTGEVVRTARFMQARVIAVVEHPADDGAAPTERPARANQPGLGFEG